MCDINSSQLLQRFSASKLSTLQVLEFLLLSVPYSLEEFISRNRLLKCKYYWEKKALYLASSHLVYIETLLEFNFFVLHILVEGGTYGFLHPPHNTI